MTRLLVRLRRWLAADDADHGTPSEIGENTLRAIIRAGQQRGRDLPCWTWPGHFAPPIPPTRHRALIAEDEHQILGRQA